MKLLLIFLLAATAAFAQTPEWSRTYHTGSVTCLDFSNDGRTLLSGGVDSTIKLWNVSSGDTTKTFKSIKAKIDNVDFNKTGEWFISSSAESPYTSKINISKDSIINNIYCPPSFPFSVGINPELIASVLSNNDSNFVTLWSGTSFHPKYSSKDGAVSRYAIEGKTSGNIGTIFIIYTSFTTWCADAKREKFYVQKLVRDTQKKTETPVFSFTSPYWQLGTSAATFISKDKQLLIATSSGKIYITNYDSSEVVDSLGSPTELAVLLANDLRNRYYISVHVDSTLRLWTPGIPNVFKRIQLQSPVTTIAVSPDSIRFATAHTDGTVAVWNIDSLAYYAQTDTVLTDITEENSFKNFTLSAEPNPFKSSTTIHYSLPKSLQIKLTITDILGKEIAVLKDEWTESGEQSVIFKNENLPDGMYYITLSGEGIVKTIPVQVSR